MAPSVSEGIAQGDESRPSRPEPTFDFTNRALAERAAASSEARPAPEPVQPREPWNDPTDTIDRAILADQIAGSGTDVQAALREGAPTKPEEEIDFRDFEVDLGGGEIVNAQQIWDALGDAATENENLLAELGERHQAEALDAFYDAVAQGFGDHIALVDAAADMFDAVVDGHLSGEEAHQALSEAVADQLNFVDDPDEFFDSEDERLQRAQLEEAVRLASELALQQVAAREFETDRQRAQEKIPAAVEARTKEMFQELRAWAADANIATSEEASARLDAAQRLLEQTGVSLEQQVLDPRSWDREAWGQALREADAALTESRRAEVAHAFHQELLAADTSIDRGLTMPGPFGPVPMRQDVLPHPLSRPDRIAERALPRVERRRSGEDLRAALMRTESTSVAEGLRAGEGE